jgi:VWFA-related protein
MLPTMRLAALCLLSVCAAWPQFRSTVQLVVAPVTVTDSKGNFVNGLDASDLILYDNNVPQHTQVDSEIYPISLVVAVQTSKNAGPILDKLGSSGILFSQLLAADQGETALVTFSDTVHRRVEFTKSPDDLIRVLKKIRPDGYAGVTLDAITVALDMLSHRPPGRRPIICVIGETRDRSSNAKLPEVVHEIEHQNVAVYWLTYSAFLAPYTDRKVKTYGDIEDEKEKGLDKKHDETRVPDDSIPWDLVAGIKELARLPKPNIANLFTRTTGATTIVTFSKSQLEKAIHAIGDEVHRQYILSFPPPVSTPGLFHTIQVAVKGRPDLHVKTRQGYWTIQPEFRS